MRREVFIPIREVNRLHWTFVHVRPETKCIIYHDSFHTKGLNICQDILDFIEKENKIFKRKFERSEWKFEAANDLPKQADGVRYCGSILLFLR